MALGDLSAVGPVLNPPPELQTPGLFHSCEQLRPSTVAYHRDHQQPAAAPAPHRAVSLEALIEQLNSPNRNKNPALVAGRIYCHRQDGWIHYFKRAPAPRPLAEVLARPQPPPAVANPQA